MLTRNHRWSPPRANLQPGEVASCACGARLRLRAVLYTPRHHVATSAGPARIVTGTPREVVHVEVLVAGEWVQEAKAPGARCTR